jgi:hypothetical protein
MVGLKSMKPIVNLTLNTVKNCRLQVARLLRWWIRLSESEQQDALQGYKMTVDLLKLQLAYFKQESEQDVEKRLKVLEGLMDSGSRLRKV